MLKFQSIPSTTDSTPITRACSSVGGAAACSMMLLVVAKARFAARFAESFLPDPNLKCQTRGRGEKDLCLHTYMHTYVARGALQFVEFELSLVSFRTFKVPYVLVDVVTPKCVGWCGPHTMI